jgi:acetyltransferase-like isoleucine patch superfamily enzyme
MDENLTRKIAVNQSIGVGTVIHESAEFINVEKITLGDHCIIGPGVRVIGGEFELGDYSKIHNNCYIYSKNHIRLGHCTWIGQGSHLDGTGGITAGDFLGVGINSALYSHIRHGDITEGCRYEKDSYLRIGHDVWFVGMCLVSPINAQDKSMAMLGSVITKDMYFNRVYGGNPSKDITEKVGSPWIEKSTDEKINILQKYVDMYWQNNKEDFEKDSVVICEKHPLIYDDRTYYEVNTRTYTKRNTLSEINLNKWLFGYRAKFRPLTKINNFKCILNSTGIKY